MSEENADTRRGPPMVRSHDRDPWPDLRERIDLQVAGTALPLVHVTTVGWARAIIASGRILTRRCDVLGEELVFTFLGKPDYRYEGDEEKSDELARFPVALLLDADEVPHRFVHPSTQAQPHRDAMRMPTPALVLPTTNSARMQCLDFG